MSEPTAGATRRTRHSRRAHAQPQEHRPHPAAERPDHRHGRQRVGEVLARLRHHLRRRPAALRRVALGIRSAIPRADGETRRGLHRRAFRRPSPSARRTASATPARLSARPPRSTITCACSTLGSAERTAGGCGLEVVRESAEVVARRLAGLPVGTRLIIGFEMPVVAAPRSNGNGAEAADETGEAPPEMLRLPAEPEPNGLGAIEPSGSGGTNGANGSTNGADPIGETLEALRRKGFGRLLLDGRTAVSFDDIEGALLKDRSVLHVVVDRLRVQPDILTRLTDSIETAYGEGGGAAFARRTARRRARGRSARSRTAAPTCSRNGSSAARAASPTRIRSPGCSRSTTRSGPAKRATVSGTSSSSTRSWWCRTRRVRSTTTRSNRGASRTTARTWPISSARPGAAASGWMSRGPT